MPGPRLDDHETVPTWITEAANQKRAADAEIERCGAQDPKPAATYDRITRTDTCDLRTKVASEERSHPDAYLRFYAVSSS